MTRRSAIYARFSSDLQRERSIEDQVALCRDYAQRNGYEIVSVFSDRAMTGASLHSRHGMHELLQSAKAGLFDFVIAESLSRLARDQEDAPAIRKRLDFAGVKIVTVADGLVSPLLHGLRTIIDCQYLVDLKSAVRRGMRGVIHEGRHAGGLIYGYRTVAGRPGELAIVPEQAEAVRRIFSEYIAGETPRAIAARLNAEGVPPPRKAYWRASTINGHTKRKTGILQNELYCGRLVWFRAYRVRDPDTGRRIWRYRPPTEWQRNEVPHLRIVEDDVFTEAQRMRALRERPHCRPQARPKRILSGLLRCASCGAGMSKKDIDHGRPRIVCTRMKEAGTCQNRRSYYLDEIEKAVLGGLREEFGTRDAVAYFLKCYNEEWEAQCIDREPKRTQIEAEVRKIEGQIKNAVGAIIDGRITEDEGEVHLPALRARLSELKAKLTLARAEPIVLNLKPAVLDNYRRDLDRLDEIINRDLAEGDEGAAAAIRKMIESVTIVPTAAGSTPGIVVRGELNSLLGLDPFPGVPAVGGAGGAG